MAGFLIDTSKGETPESLRRKREVVQQLMTRNAGRVPQDIGEGIASLGSAISNNLAFRDLERAESEGMSAAQQKIVNAFSPGAAAGLPSPATVSAPAPAPVPSGPVVPNDANAIPGTVGMDMKLADASQDFIQDNPNTYLSSGVRSTADQARLYADRANNPNPVAVPGTSRHERGLAVDIGGMTPDQRALLPQYGLSQPVPGDPPHVELAGGDPAALPVNAQATQGQLPTQGRPNTGPTVQALMQLASDPWVAQNKALSGIVNAYMANAIKQQDPAYALDIAQKQKDLARSDAPASVQEYEYYKKTFEPSDGQAKPLSYSQWDVARKKAGAISLPIQLGTEAPDGALRKKLDEGTAKNWSAWQEAGHVSAGQMQDMQMLDELIKIAPQGPLTGRLAEAFPGVSSAGDAFNSIVKRVAPTMRAPGSGSTSDIEYDGFLRSLPALRNKPEANAAISEMMKAKAGINIERSDVISQYSQNQITRNEAERRLGELNKRSIMTPALRQMLSGLGGKDADVLPGDVVDGYRFKGGNKADKSSWEKVQ